MAEANPLPMWPRTLDQAARRVAGNCAAAPFGPVVEVGADAGSPERFAAFRSRAP